MGTNADHQRAWRERQKAKIAELEAELSRLRKATRDSPKDKGALAKQIKEIKEAAASTNYDRWSEK